MKQNLLMTLAMLMGCYICSNAQISIRTEVCAAPTQQVEAYDSLSNFNYNVIGKEYQTENLALSNVSRQFKQFIGQSI